jgi:hypothetical protein
MNHYPDLSKVRKSLPSDERIKQLEQDQITTNIRIDELLEQLKRIRDYYRGLTPVPKEKPEPPRPMITLTEDLK